MTTHEHQDLLSTLENLDFATFSDQDERVRVLRGLQAAAKRLEAPFEALMRLTYQEVCSS